MSLRASVSGIGLLGPGLANWAASRDVLRGTCAYAPVPTVLPAPEILPPTERRRTGRNVRLALAVGLDAVGQTGRAASDFAAVFASSSGDGDNYHAICEALASDDRLLSPTRFHNSVHNAPAGYWSIATGAMKSIDSLGAFDASFGAGMLDAFSRIAVEPADPVIVIAYDVPYPEPLNSVRPLPDAFGTAFALAPADEGTGMTIAIELSREAPSTLPDPALESLRRAVPAARALPLLALMASGRAGRVLIEYLPGLSIAMEARP